VHTQPTTVVRTAGHIAALIAEARLPDRVAERSVAVFDALAEAEGRLHRRPPSQVHFHEVGAVDSIIDIVGACAALEILEIGEIYASAVATGSGMVRAAHGLIPNPPPAVVELLRGAPTYGIDTTIELTTPTGAAILAALSTGWGPLPAMQLRASGFGAGSADPDERPNLVQVVVGEQVARAEPGQPVTLLETNVDDITGEVLAHTVERLMAAGAHDAWLTPAVGKKGRPVHLVSVLCDPVQARALADLLTQETGSLGVRGRTFERWVAARQMGEVDVEGYPVRVKVTAGRVKAEHDDAARVARQLGRPLREVIARAEQSWREAHPVEAVPGDDTADVLSLGPWLGDGIASEGIFGDPSGHRHGVDLPPDGDAG
jgi:pyridinium-3,5-bisthiocarboxylic acid mononucleotide nickel chelatase